MLPRRRILLPNMTILRINHTPYLQVHERIFIRDNAKMVLVKVRLEKRRPLHAKIQVVLVVAEEPVKVRLEVEF